MRSAVPLLLRLFLCPRSPAGAAGLARPLRAAYRPSMTCKLMAIIEQDQDGVFAYGPELKGCHTQGDTVEEALANLREAAELYLETLEQVWSFNATSGRT